MDITWNQIKAGGKHVASYVAGGVTVAVAMGLFTKGQGGEITDNINSISSGIESIAKGIGGLIAVVTPIYTTWRAAHNASPVMQAQSLEKEVPGTIVVTSQKIADATPSSPNVVSNADVKVVPK